MIIVDTGVLYALADRRDAHHRVCVQWLASASPPLVIPPEVDRRDFSVVRPSHAPSLVLLPEQL